jgi:hypothetical protein
MARTAFTVVFRVLFPDESRLYLFVQDEKKYLITSLVGKYGRGGITRCLSWTYPAATISVLHLHSMFPLHSSNLLHPAMHHTTRWFDLPSLALDWLASIHREIRTKV